MGKEQDSRLRSKWKLSELVTGKRQKVLIGDDGLSMAVLIDRGQCYQSVSPKTGEELGWEDHRL